MDEADHSVKSIWANAAMIAMMGGGSIEDSCGVLHAPAAIGLENGLMPGVIKGSCRHAKAMNPARIGNAFVFSYFNLSSTV